MKAADDERGSLPAMTSPECLSPGHPGSTLCSVEMSARANVPRVVRGSGSGGDDDDDCQSSRRRGDDEGMLVVVVMMSE